MIVIDCPNIVSAKAPIARLLNTPLSYIYLLKRLLKWKSYRWNILQNPWSKVSMSGYMVARIKKIMPNLVENMILRICHVVEKLWFEFINLYSKFLSKYSLVPNSHYIYWQNCTKSVHEVTKNKDLFAKTKGYGIHCLFKDMST